MSKQILLEKLDKLQNEKKQSLFEKAAESRGYSPRKPTREEKAGYHVSHVLTGKSSLGKKVCIKVDLKKNKNKKKFEDWVWIEFKNSKGKPGWIHGDAHFLVFERSEDFIFVNRKELVEWLSSANKIRYDLPFVGLAKQAKYRIYKRANKPEEITQIAVKDIKSLKSFQIWPKNA